MLYFDYGAGMPVEKEALDAMTPYFRELYGNPSAVHGFGAENQNAVANARGHVSKLVNAGEKDHIIFTSCATESNNLALKGVARRSKRKGNHIITTNIEHWSVHTPLKALEKEGFSVTRVPVEEKTGIVDPTAIGDAITDETVLISVMAANNEIGTIQPVKEIASIAHEHGISVHTDATAALGRVPVDVREMGADLLTMSSNDIYGPKGVGALYVKQATRIEPIIHGGGQEFGFRSGTENVPGIVGMGIAARIAMERLPSDMQRVSSLQSKMIDGILETIPYTYLNGDRDHRLPNNVNILFGFIEGESILLSLDVYGVAASTGSACSSKTLSPSHVLSALGQDNEQAHGSVQFNMGRYTTEEEIDTILAKLPPVVERLRKLSPLTPKGYFKE